MSIFWIEGGWVNEFTTMIFGIKGGFSSSTYNDKLINSLTIMEILVKVILEMLDGVHMLLNKIVSSYFFKWEGLIVKIPGVDTVWSSDWLFTLLFELSVDVHGIVIVMLIKASGKIVKFNIQLFLSNRKSIMAD
jgi:hypothetical protein